MNMKKTPDPLSRVPRIGRAAPALGLAAIVLLAAVPAWAQATAPRPATRPTGRISFYTNVMQIRPDGTPAVTSTDLITAVQFELPDGDGNRLEYGVDMRRTESFATNRPSRMSVYDGYVGARLANGRARVRVGQMWLTDLGGLGSMSGAMFEYRGAQPKVGGSRLRLAGFAGVEPDPYGFGHAKGVTKGGVYAVLEAPGGRRHTAGYVRISQAGLTERSVLTGSNFLRAGSRVFVYQMAEFDLTGPAGQGKGGLSYLMVNAHSSVNDHLELQGLYHRGRSIDTRSITDDVLNGRPVKPGALDGLLFESAGGRVTVRVQRDVRVNAGYTRDRNNRDSTATGRLTVGASATNLAHSGVDLTVSESRMSRPTGQYNSLYLSAGRQVGTALYLTTDFSSSVSIVRFTRSDGFTLETKPRTRQIGASGIVTLSRNLSLLITADRTRDDDVTDLRLLAGLTVRFR